MRKYLDFLRFLGFALVILFRREGVCCALLICYAGNQGICGVHWWSRSSMPLMLCFYCQNYPRAWKGVFRLVGTCLLEFAGFGSKKYQSYYFCLHAAHFAICCPCKGLCFFSRWGISKSQCEDNALVGSRCCRPSERRRRERANFWKPWRRKSRTKKYVVISQTNMVVQTLRDSIRGSQCSWIAPFDWHASIGSQ